MTHHLDNPDWYRVVYNLAALRANRAARTGSQDDDANDLEEAEKDAQRLVDEGTKQAKRLLPRLTPAGREHQRFFTDNLVPSAELLLAGVRLDRAKKDAKQDPLATIDQVMKNERVAARVHYNAACLLSEWLRHSGDTKEEVADRAFKELRLFVWKADPGEAALMGPWAEEDPTLKSLARHNRERFKRIFDFAKAAPKPKPPPK